MFHHFTNTYSVQNIHNLQFQQGHRKSWVTDTSNRLTLHHPYTNTKVPKRIKKRSLPKTSYRAPCWALRRRGAGWPHWGHPGCSRTPGQPPSQGGTPSGPFSTDGPASALLWAVCAAVRDHPQSVVLCCDEPWRSSAEQRLLPVWKQTPSPENTANRKNKNIKVHPVYILSQPASRYHRLPLFLPLKTTISKDIDISKLTCSFLLAQFLKIHL